MSDDASSFVDYATLPRNFDACMYYWLYTVLRDLFDVTSHPVVPCDLTYRASRSSGDGIEIVFLDGLECNTLPQALSEGVSKNFASSCHKGSSPR